MKSFSIVTTWGLLIFGIAFILTIILAWCHDVNQKLRYILVRLERIGREKDAPLERNINAAPRKAVSPVVAVGVIGAAIFFLVLIPIWFINK